MDNPNKVHVTRNTKMSPLHVFGFINIHLCFNTKHIAVFSNPGLHYLCLTSVLDKLFPLLPPAGGRVLKIFNIIYIFSESFKGSLKKQLLEEHTQNDTTTTSILAGIHRTGLVLRYFSSDTIQGKETSPFKGAFTFQHQRAKILVSPNTESIQGGEMLSHEGFRGLENCPCK